MVCTAHRFVFRFVSINPCVRVSHIYVSACVCVCVCSWGLDLKSRGMLGANSRRSEGRQRRRMCKEPVSRTDFNLYSLKDPDNPDNPEHPPAPITPLLLTPALSRFSSWSARLLRRLSSTHTYIWCSQFTAESEQAFIENNT